MEINADKGRVAVERIGGIAGGSSAAAVSAAEDLIGGFLERVADVLARLRDKQPLVSVAIIIVKDNNLASPGGQIGDLPQDESLEGAVQAPTRPASRAKEKKKP